MNETNEEEIEQLEDWIEKSKEHYLMKKYKYVIIRNWVLKFYRYLFITFLIISVVLAVTRFAPPSIIDYLKTINMTG